MLYIRNCFEKTQILAVKQISSIRNPRSGVSFALFGDIEAETIEGFIPSRDVSIVEFIFFKRIRLVLCTYATSLMVSVWLSSRTSCIGATRTPSWNASIAGPHIFASFPSTRQQRAFHGDLRAWPRAIVCHSFTRQADYYLAFPVNSIHSMDILVRRTPSYQIWKLPTMSEQRIMLDLNRFTAFGRHGRRELRATIGANAA